ncbi:hypothetical protein M408DRAFT_326254 [Serendipita vermifera MAFF 305830]|uniref:SAM domain-containing protein n=1 Tax=Serendipita vermifera MAFF 305830 TaxID=933852 RepID=A0A0C2XXI0_SERVB|nr:hypothetical protein M408DRAFT_326254 [Serendipita vermifera MAFF 305830]
MGSVESPSPSSVSFPGNGGPYAIKTTSTAVLSRSNSLSGRSPTPVLYTSSPNAKPLGRSQSRGHRHTRSLSNATSPLPLPVPPKRRDSQGSTDSLSLPPTPNEGAISQLPDNPKDWTPSQLSVYLASALRLKGGGSIPAPVAKDIAGFAFREKLAGRAFLRLSDESLKSMGVNHLWREALLSASRTLRKKVLKGRIWGFGSPNDGAEEDETPTKYSKRRIPSTVDEDVDQPASPSSPATNYRGGRVRGMIESIERSEGSTGSAGSDETDPNESVNERIEQELKDAGLWIGSDAEEDDADDIGNLSSSSSLSDNELVVDYHSRDSSGSQPPAYTRTRSPQTLEEPSVEELLASEGMFPEQLGKQVHIVNGGTLDEAPSWGAMMWERDADIAGGTAKRIIEPIAPSSTRVRVINGGEQPNIHTLFNNDASVQQDAKEETPSVDTEARSLLQSFKLRLEQMEKRLAELELRDEEREHELTSLREKEKQRQKEDEQQLQQEAESRKRIDLSSDADVYAGRGEEGDEESVDIPWPRPTKAPLPSSQAITPLIIPGESNPITAVTQPGPEKPTSEAKADAHTATEHDDPPLEMIPADPLPSALPSYVLLVGVGVCAVVIRVLFRKIGSVRRA